MATTGPPPRGWTACVGGTEARLPVVLALVAALAGCGGAPPGPAASPSPASSPSASPSASPAPSPPPPSPSSAETPERVVGDFLGSLGAESRRAWSLLRVDLRAPSRPGAVVVELPESGATVDRGSELRAAAPAQSRPTVLVDSEVQPSESEPSDGDRLLVTSSPDLAPGRHVLVLVAVRADGIVDAEAVVFQIG